MNIIHVRFWVFIVLIAFALGPIFRTPKEMSSFVKAEVGVTVSALGENWGGKVVRKSIDLFASAPIQATYHIFKNGQYDLDKVADKNVLYKAASSQMLFSLANKMVAGWGAMLFIISIFTAAY